MPIERTRARRHAALLFALLAGPARAADVSVAMAPGAPETVFRSSKDGCAPIDTPDIDPRAFRDDKGGVVMFALHYVNRPLRGPDLSHLREDCAVALDSALDGDPARYNDRRYLTATWTDDGRNVAAVVHHEYHAEDHGRCARKATIECWYNSLIAFSSRDGGATFAMDKPAVVASAPFPQDVEQGRHRGFFNPSNIVSDGVFKYFMASTTGWAGQRSGPCLFRSENPLDSAAWRAWDGVEYSVRYSDPYAGKAPKPRACAPIAPFGLPVGTIVRHMASGRWIAVWMAKADHADIPASGFYYATAASLTDWSAPRLLMAGKTIHDAGCGGSLIAYPSIVDEASRSRNFDEAGSAPWLYYATIAMRGCDTGERTLVRARLSISASMAAGR
jgi:hypothetical protein